MQAVSVILLLSAAFPLVRAWRANRATSLVHAVNWTVAAWFAWVLMVVYSDTREPLALDPPRYLALALTGCAGIAVLGARRPQVAAWNFVVLGLLAVLVLPLIENLVTGPQALDPLRTVFLAGTLAIGILNYLPTRFGLAALILALASTSEMRLLISPDDAARWAGGVLVGLVPWLAWLRWKYQAPPRSQFDQLWLDFRNRYGLAWGLRLREQFNRSAVNAGWPARLYWQGLLLKSGTALPEPAVQEAMLETLRALLKRFM